MKRVILYLLLAVSAFGAQRTPLFDSVTYQLTPTNIWQANITAGTNIVIAYDSLGRPTLNFHLKNSVNVTPDMSMEVVTNIIGAHLGKSIIDMAAGDYIIPTNTFSWAKAGVTNWFRAFGVTIRTGHPADTSGTGIRKLFTDAAGPSVLIVEGYPSIIISNNSTFAYDMVDPLSEWYVTMGPSYATNTGGGGPAFVSIVDGKFSCGIRGTIDQWRVYDTFVLTPQTVGSRISLYADGYARIRGVSDAIEAGTVVGGEPPHAVTIDGIFFENLPPHTGGPLWNLQGSVLVRNCVLNAKTNNSVQYSYVADTIGQIENCYVHGVKATGSLIETVDFGGGHFRVVSTVVTNSGAGIPVTLDLSSGSSIEFSDSKLFASTAPASLNASAISTVEIAGFLQVNKPVHGTNIVINGGPLLYQSFTNNYTGTNVPISLNAYQDQVLDVTNSALLIITNNTGLLSGKKVGVTLINNKSTNMNIAYTASGLRLFGQNHNTVTNGRALRLEIEKIGTNYNVTASQQQN